MLRSTVLLCCALTAVLGTTACSSSESDTAAARPAASTAPSESAPAGSAPSESAPATSPSASPAAPAEAAGPAQIVIQSFDYEVPATVEAGAVIEVTNEDAEAHTVTLADSDISIVVAGGETVQMTAPAEAGEYGISCEVHGGMEATLVVV